MLEQIKGVSEQKANKLLVEGESKITKSPFTLAPQLPNVSP